jgi:PKD repeat protein
MMNNTRGKMIVWGLILLFIGNSCSLVSTMIIPAPLKESQQCIVERTAALDQPRLVQEKKSILQDRQRDIVDWYGCDCFMNWWISSEGYLAPSILPNFPSGSDIDSEGNWYAVDYAGGIYQIYYDGYQVFVAPSIPLHSLTYDPWTELWYGCDSTNLYIVDITTGETSVIGPLNVPNIIIGISCNLAGEMYGYDILWTGDSTLYSINVDTGECTAIGSMGYGFVYAQDCCFDRDNDNYHLYISAYFNDGSPSGMVLCDVTTGACTLIWTFPGGMEVDALTFPYGVSNWMLPPRANFSWTPPTPSPGETILFNASTSVDDDGDITLYEWDWNNDSIYDESSTSPVITHLWTSPGEYPITLRITDDTALTATKSHIVQVISNPPSPPVIHGPDYGYVGVAYTFTMDPITDPDGDAFYCLWDWGDGTNTDWLGPYQSGSSISASHVWMHAGVYEIKAKVKINGAESNWSEPLPITIVEYHPPVKPIIEGPVIGTVGVLYNFTISITDPEAEQFYFQISWGDGITTEWLGPYDSGEEALVSHDWGTPGIYSILVKAKNPYGEESVSDPFIIKIVELKKALLFGVVDTQSETDDLRIIETNLLIFIPSESIVYHGVPVVIAKKYLFGFIGSSLFGGIFEAAVLLE